MKYYPIKKTPKDIIVSRNGQWDFPGIPTRIPSNSITMQGVNYPLMAYPNGDPNMQIMLYPGQDYMFPPDVNYVDEYPLQIAQVGKIVINPGMTQASAQDINKAHTNASPGLSWQQSLAEAKRKEQIKLEQERQRKIQEQRDINERKSAAETRKKVIGGDENAIFTFPDGTTKAWKDMDWREQSYVSGKNLGSFNNNNWTDYINPAAMIGSMGEGLATSPYVARETNSVLPYVTGFGAPLLTGALAGIGAKTTGQFVNNTVNPFAGIGEYLTTQTPLRNTWKLNPWAFKPDPKAYYHRSPNLENIINRETGMLQGFRESEAGKAYTEAANAPFSGINLKKGANNQLYFSKGVPLDWGRYNPKRFDFAGNPIMSGQGYPGPYLVEVEGVPMGRSVKGRKPSLDAPTNLEGYAVSHRPINLNEAKFYKEDWLRGYKPIEVPKGNFKSEIGSIDFRKNPLSYKDKEMYKWFEEQIRFDALPLTKNKQSLEVLENFKQRINTPEGKQRLKDLGITEDQMLHNLKIIEDNTSYGYFRPDKNTIAIHPDHPMAAKVARHEIEHGVQNALRQSKINKVIDGTTEERLKALNSKTTEIDDILSNLSLRKEGTPNKVWKQREDFKNPVNINEYSSIISNKQNATDYFLTGSEGAEKSAFLGEVQEYMMKKGVIPKNSYVNITPEMVENTFIDAMFDEKMGGKYLRLFNIMKADPKNYELISKGLNKMLGTVPAVIGAAALQQGVPQQRKGGQIGGSILKNYYKNELRNRRLY